MVDSWFGFCFLQKILDQIADIDMVLNFKCPNESTSLERSSSVLRMKSQGEQLISANLAWKEKFAFYAEQVLISAFKSRRFRWM